GARGAAERRSRGGNVLRAEPARRLRPVPPRRVRGRGRQLRRPRHRVQAADAGARRGSAVITSEELRNELATIAPARRCCRLAELSALFHAAGAWHLRGGALAVHLDLADSAAARRAFALLRDVGVRSEIRTYRRRAFDQAT